MFTGLADKHVVELYLGLQADETSSLLALM